MVEYTQMIIFLVIFVAVPLQFLLSPSASDVRYHLHNLKISLSHFLGLFSRKEETLDESVSISENEEDTKYFAKILKSFLHSLNSIAFSTVASLEPRDPRPPFVKYRIGDVIRHKIHGYRGVIIGWDEKATAPQSWLDRTHKGRKDWSEMPNYSVLIDTRDRLVPQLAYIVQDNIELGEGSIFHPLIKHFFESFDGKHYIPRPWRKKVYPND
ncbi:unnamed protein product [Thelazia callipaeda]|uniref:YccV-like domain-containing protein n=1 Tax=Thelazia callipaeda TaxID=103827 RepID=A0A0N5D2L6_THECL|nr:unnamed protein product [Thelazia callipaeda]